MNHAILKRDKILLIGIVLVAGFLRLYQLGSLPSGFHSDEVLNGYVGRYTLQNGMDLYGNRWPLIYFDNFGDYPNIIPMYISGLFTFVLGVNELAVRLPIAAAGIASVWLIFLIARLLTRDRYMPLLAAFILAISPWHIVLSRATAEGITASAVFLAGLYWLLQAVKRQRVLPLIYAFFFFLFDVLVLPRLPGTHPPDIIAQFIFNRFIQIA